MSAPPRARARCKGCGVPEGYGRHLAGCQRELPEGLTWDHLDEMVADAPDPFTAETLARSLPRRPPPGPPAARVPTTPTIERR